MASAWIEYEDPICPFRPLIFSLSTIANINTDIFDTRIVTSSEEQRQDQKHQKDDDEEKQEPEAANRVRLARN